MLLLGILLGLGCATSHALSYLFTRSFVSAPGRSGRELLALGHILMAGFSILLLPFVWMEPSAGWPRTLWPLLAAAGFYLLAQGGFFLALKHMPASRASPLLGIKLIFIAAFGSLFFQAHLAPIQWAAVGLAVVAGLCLHRAGGRLPATAICWLLLTCAGYALSDLHIQKLLTAVDPQGSLRSTLFAVAAEYACCGLFGCALYARLRPLPADAWRRALPFALSWYAAMAFLYGAIACLGVVLAVILQSTRGLLSIGLGSLVAAWGWQHLEHALAPGDRLRQAAAALLMMLAIGLYLVAA